MLWGLELESNDCDERDEKAKTLVDSFACLVLFFLSQFGTCAKDMKESALVSMSREVNDVSFIFSLICFP